MDLLQESPGESSKVWKSGGSWEFSKAKTLSVIKNKIDTFWDEKARLLVRDAIYVRSRGQGMRRKRKVLRVQKPDCGAGEVGMMGMDATWR